jgi:hypothetical protein
LIPEFNKNKYFSTRIQYWERQNYEDGKKLLSMFAIEYEKAEVTLNISNFNKIGNEFMNVEIEIRFNYEININVIEFIKTKKIGPFNKNYFKCNIMVDKNRLLIINEFSGSSIVQINNFITLKDFIKLAFNKLNRELFTCGRDYIINVLKIVLDIKFGEVEYEIRKRTIEVIKFILSCDND